MLSEFSRIIFVEKEIGLGVFRILWNIIVIVDIGVNNVVVVPGTVVSIVKHPFPLDVDTIDIVNIDVGLSAQKQDPGINIQVPFPVARQMCVIAKA